MTETVARIEQGRPAHPSGVAVEQTIPDRDGVKPKLVPRWQCLLEQQHPAVGRLANGPGRHECGIEPTGSLAPEPWIAFRPEKAATGKLSLQRGSIQIANKHQAIGHKSLAARTHARPAFIMEIGNRLAPLSSPPSKNDLLQTLPRVR